MLVHNWRNVVYRGRASLHRFEDFNHLTAVLTHYLGVAADQFLDLKTPLFLEFETVLHYSLVHFAHLLLVSPHHVLNFPDLLLQLLQFVIPACIVELGVPFAELYMV